MSQITNIQINCLYENQVDRVYRFFYFKFFDQLAAEDCTSEVFLTLVKRIKQNQEIENLEKYLYGIVRIVFLRRLKQKYIDKLFLNIPLENFQQYVEEYTSKAEKRKSIEGLAIPFIDRLPEKQRVVVRYRLIDKMDLKDICKKLNKNMNYVKTTQKRALKSLKKLVACTL